MSLHIMYNHQCPKCGAYYIPYKEDTPCPKCGFVEGDKVDIVSEIVNSANYQMICNGFYTPLVWYIGSFGDHVASLIFEVLDKFYQQDKKSFDEVSFEYFNDGEWGKQLYLKGHIIDLSKEAYKQIEKHKNDTVKQEGNH